MCEVASIRTAMQVDATAIARVHIESWRTTYRGIVPDAYLAGLNIEERTIRWREALDSRREILVAEDDGEIVGFIDGGPIREPIGDCDAELFAIYLLSTAQKKGTGTALLIELARRLDADGFQSMAVWVLEANLATDFYAGSGAVRIAAKRINIGGAALTIAAYAWPSLRSIIALREAP